MGEEVGKPHLFPLKIVAKEEESEESSSWSFNNRGGESSNSQIQILPQSSTSGLSMVELATRFLEENVRKCIKPRIFPMESTSFPSERVPTPLPFFAKEEEEEEDDFRSRIHHRAQVLRRVEYSKLLQGSSPLSLSPSAEARRKASTSVAATMAVFSSQNRVTSSSTHTTHFNIMNGQCGISFSSMSNGHGHSHHGLNNSAHARTNSLSSPTMTTTTQQNLRTDFASVLKRWNVPIPPALSRKLGRVSESPLGKVKVMLRVCDNAEDLSGGGGPRILGVDQRRKQVTLIDPGGASSCPNGITPEERRVGVSAPKMFAFDGIFGEDDDQAEICAAAAAELVASVVGGEDACIVSLGYSGTGKKQTMFGKASTQKLGVVPTAISWLFKSIHEQKQKSSSRFSVRVSALEVTGGSVHETVTDLLLPFVNDGDQPPGAYLLDGNGSPVVNNGQKGLLTSSTTTTTGKGGNPPLLNSISEVRTPNPETAGFYLDSALEVINKRDESRGIGVGGHLVFTLHVYQYSIDKHGKGVIGGRSRLHCVLLGNGSPSISVLSGLLLAVLNGQRHLPSSNHSKLGAILRECLGSLTCRAVVMIHISNSHSRYAETLAALQLGSRVHRLRRSRKLKMGSVGSGTGSGGSSGGSGEEMRSTVVLNHGAVGEGETGSSDIDPSSSEQSCDTVIYLGPSIDEATDGEHPPVYLPSLDPDNKIVSPKCSPLGQSGNGQFPKTKSPKPKSSNKLCSEGFLTSGTSNGISEEKWIDGPKVPKYRGLQPNHVQPSSSSSSPGKNKKGETWIDGPAARVVNHQASNFPSPKKSMNHSHANNNNQMRQREKVVARGLLASGCNGNGNSSSTLDPSCITSTKAEMIQKWISNQNHSPTFFDDISAHLDESFFLGSGNNGSIFNSCKSNPSSSSGTDHHHVPPSLYPFLCGSGQYFNFNKFFPEPEYKALTVFKTCEDDEEEEEEGGESQPAEIKNELGEPHEPFEFEFIEVVEPEVPVPTKDVCIQVTEEDIALCLLGENPLPESDQSFMLYERQALDRIRSSSFSDATDFSEPLTMKSDQHQHPLRVLSQDCLTIVSTFTDSLSPSKNDDIHTFWLTNRLQQENGEGRVCHGLCKNLVTLSQLSLDNLAGYPMDDDEPIICPTNGAHDFSSLNRKSTVVHVDPLVDFRPKPAEVNNIKGPSTNKKALGGKNKECSDIEQDTIPPMELLDVNQIKNNCHPIRNKVTTTNNGNATVVPTPSPATIECTAHNHNHNSTTVATTNNDSTTTRESQQEKAGITKAEVTPPTPTPTLTPVDIPIELPPETNKSSTKSKSRKLSRFFRSRSKSPKKVLLDGASASSGSGQSSSSSDARHSSSSSSCSSSGASSVGMKQKHASPKHLLNANQSPNKYHNNALPTSIKETDYSFIYDTTNIPIFVPLQSNGKLPRE